MEIEDFKEALSKKIKEAQERGFREELYQFYCVMQSLKQASQLLDHVHASAELLIEAIGEPIIPLISDTFEQKDLKEHGLLVNPEDTYQDFEEVNCSDRVYVMLSRDASIIELSIPSTAKVTICSYLEEYLLVHSGNAALVANTHVLSVNSGLFDCKWMSVVDSRKDALVNLQEYSACIARGTTMVYGQHHAMAKLYDHSSFTGTDCSRAVVLSEGVSVCMFGFSTVTTSVAPRRLALHGNSILFQEKEVPAIVEQFHNTTKLKHVTGIDLIGARRLVRQATNPVTVRYGQFKLEEQKLICNYIADKTESPKLSNFLRTKVKEATCEAQLAAAVCSIYPDLFAMGTHPDYLRLLFNERNLVNNGFFLFDHSLIPEFVQPVDYHVFGNNAAYQPMNSLARGHFYEDSLGIIDSNTGFFHQNTIGVGRGDAMLMADGMSMVFGTENNRIEACDRAMAHGYQNTTLTVRDTVMAVVADNAKCIARDRSAVLVTNMAKAETYEQASGFAKDTRQVAAFGDHQPKSNKDLPSCELYKEIATRRPTARPGVSLSQILQQQAEDVTEVQQVRNPKGLHV